eukprot:384048-Amphidinium_carterae.1
MFIGGKLARDAPMNVQQSINIKSTPSVLTRSILSTQTFAGNLSRNHAATQCVGGIPFYKVDQ